MLNHKLKTILAGAALVGALSAVAPTSALAARRVPSRAQCQIKDFKDGRTNYHYIKSETRTSELGSRRITHFYVPDLNPQQSNKWCAYNTTGPEQFNTGTW